MFGRSALVVALVMGCGRTEASSASSVPLASAATNAPGASVLPASASSVAVPPIAAAWPAIVRDEQWDAAWTALEMLPDDEKMRPEIRYVRSRVAIARDDAAAALPLLEGLESSLPLLADEVARWRAQAQLSVGPFAQAGEWFAGRVGPAAQLDAARAFEKAKDPRRARAAADRVIASAKRTRVQEAEARALRIRVSDAPGESERADALWLASYGADVAPVDALALVARLDPRHPLTAQDLVVRARAMSDAGRVDDALRAVDLASGAPGADKVTDLERARSRGMALFHARGRGTEAARTLAECAGAGGPHAAEDAFHAARALSRADRDEEAIRGYEEVERRFPRSPWAEGASFFVPYLRMLHAEWRECTSGFDAYLRAHPAGEHAREARRDGALCKLLEGDSKGARVAFERLSEDEQVDPIAGARMASMAALAALRDGDRMHAVALWTAVARSHPLSWPSLVARARLADLGVRLPPAIEQASDDAGPLPALAIVVPPPADLLHRIGLEQDAETALRERESAVVSGAGSRLPEALCAAYGELARARRRYQIAQALPSSLFAKAPGPRTRWAWDCAFPSPYAEAVRAAEARESLPAGLLWAVMRQESAFDPDAISAAHAVGLMQLLPETARGIADELPASREEARLTSPPYAIRVGARLLRKLLERFHGNVPLAIAAYNGGADAIDRWLSRAPGMQLDTFVERIPFDETRDYVSRVMGNLARYGYLAQGDEGVPRLELDLKEVARR